MVYTIINYFLLLAKVCIDLPLKIEEMKNVINKEDFKSFFYSYVIHRVETLASFCILHYVISIVNTSQDQSPIVT